MTMWDHLTPADLLEKLRQNENERRQTVTLTNTEWERVLWCLHRAAPPPAPHEVHAFNKRIARKIRDQRDQLRGRNTRDDIPRENP